MDNDEFRRHGHNFVDWMADYLAGIEDQPVRSQAKPDDVAGKLPGAAPETGEPMAEIFTDFKRVIMPGITHWQHPSFFAYFTANSSPPSVLAEMLTAALAVQGMLWQTSPAATELETVVMDWLRRAIGLPKDFTGVIHDTASVATLSALVVARERALDWAGNDKGLSEAGRMTVYASEEVHSSVDKAVRIAGFGQDNLRKVASDRAGGLRPEALAEAIAADRADGARPVAVVATLGSTGRGGFDPLAQVAEIAGREKLWLHVDAAWAGSALILPTQRWMIEGIEGADSFVFNPHKWLFTNFDCTAFFVRDPEALKRTFSVQPAYLRTREGDEVIDYRDWGIQLGRRFRALKLWFVLRSYGLEALRAKLANHISWASELAAQVASEPDFEVTSPCRLALFSFRYRPKGLEPGPELDELNTRLLEALNDSGRMYLSPGEINGETTIRFNIGQTTTERHHVQDAWARIRETARSL